MLRRLVRVLGELLRPSRVDLDLREEIETHIALETERLQASGLERQEAARRARVAFGGTAASTEECRQARGLQWMDEVRGNVRFAIRQLSRNPAFTAGAVLTLALCIGANTAVFSAIDAVLIRPLPFPDADRLRILAVELSRNKTLQFQRTSHTGQAWEAIRNKNDVLDAAVFRPGSSGRNLTVDGQAEFALQQRVSAGFFRVLGSPPAFGRGFGENEDRVGGPAVAVVSSELATRLFETPEESIGRTIRLKGEPHRVVGVMPPGFVTSRPADVWTPLRPSLQGEGAGSNYTIVVRPRDGVSIAQAEAAIAPLLGEVFDLEILKDPRAAGVAAQLRLAPLQLALTQRYERSLHLLWAAAGLVLLIGCINIAGLLTSRLDARSRELAVRQALGGGRGAVVRQLLTESLVLGLCGGAAGVVLAYVGLGAFRALLQEGFSIWQPLELDERVLAISAATALGCGLLFGLYPALLGSRSRLRSVLARGGRGASAGTGWLRRSIVTAQVALCLLLLFGAGLMIRTLANLRGLQPGFDPRGVVAADISLDDARYGTAAATSRLFNRGLALMRERGEVAAAGVGQSLPYERAINTGFRFADEQDAEPRITDIVYVAGDYFDALGIPVLRGRLLAATDAPDTESVAVVNRAFVERYMDDRAPLGARLAMGGDPKRIVGVVGDVQQRPGWGGREVGPLAAMATVYVPVGQYSDEALARVHQWSTPSWIVRSKAPADQAAEALSADLRALDPLLPVASVRTMQEVRGQSWARQRVQAVLLSLLAGLALLLAGVGMYGVMAGLIAGRMREAGIRMALGGGRWATSRAAAWPGLVLVGVGVGLGLALIPPVARWLESLVWGVGRWDAWSLLGSSLVLLSAAAIATFVPVTRLLRLEPAAVLRDE